MAACLSAVCRDGSAQLPAEAGLSSAAPKRLVDYLDELRAEGLVVIYTNELVPDTLLVESEPIGATPRTRLASVLGRLGLMLERGPQDTWLIVRQPPPRTSGSPPEADPEIFIAPPAIENIIVTASRYAFSRELAGTGNFVDRVQLETAPDIGGDALRPIANIPGVSANGLSGRMAIRGGTTDETLILLDGVELVSPFHLKDFESIFGSISPRIVEGMDVYTGGFSTRYGGRMSGVVDMEVMAPELPSQFEVGLSTINSSFAGGGRLERDRGDWLVSLRRGTVDLLLDAVDSDFGSPQFSDVFGRIRRRLGDTGEFRFGVLSLDDKIALQDGSAARAEADYDDNYLWAGYSHEIGDALSAEYLLWFANIDSLRNGETRSDSTSFGRLEDRRRQSSVTFKAEWLYRGGERKLIDWGVKAALNEAIFDFASAISIPFPITSPLQGSGGGSYRYFGELKDTETAAWLNYRYRLLDDLTLDLGARLDTHSINDDREFSPRIGALWQASSRVAFRAGWGKYTQAQRIDELQVSDRLPRLFASQRSDQRVLSMELAASTQLRLRMEFFDKRFTTLKPRFENLYLRLSLVPELMPDRVALSPEKARASGLELSLDGDLRDWRWWISYSRADAEDLIDDRWLRRSWQETWSGKAGFIWTAARWNVAATLIARSGWPISQPEIRDGQLTVDAFNDRVFESFRSLDVRASRSIALKRGKLEVFAELINALDENNHCCYEQSVTGDPATGASALQLDTLSWLPSVPVLGFLWEFGHSTQP